MLRTFLGVLVVGSVLVSTASEAHDGADVCRTGTCCNAITNTNQKVECNQCISKAPGCSSPPTLPPFVCRHYHKKNGLGRRCLPDNGRD